MNDIVKKKPGRPRKRPPKAFTPEKIRELAFAGVSKKNLAWALRTTPRVLNRWIEECPELDEAFEAGRAALEYDLVSDLVKDGKAGNVDAKKFLLKGMFGWREGDAAGQGNQVNVLFHMPDAMPMTKFLEMHENASNGSEPIPVARSLVAQRG